MQTKHEKYEWSSKVREWTIPSSVDKYNKNYPVREKSNKKAGGQVGHIGTNKALVEEFTQAIEINDKKCPYCGCEHFIEQSKNIQRKQMIDIDKISAINCSQVTQISYMVLNQEK